MPTTGARRGQKLFPHGPATGAIITPHDGENNLIVKTQNSRKTMVLGAALTITFEYKCSTYIQENKVQLQLD